MLDVFDVWIFYNNQLSKQNKKFRNDNFILVSRVVLIV